MDTILEIEEEISDYERERGKPMPSFEHALTQSTLLSLIKMKYPNVLVLSELSLKLSDDFAPTPDVCIYPKQMMADLRKMKGKKITIPPQLAVEILSPKQALQDLFDKAELFLNHSVDEVWVIIPEIQSITVCRQGLKQRTYTTGSVQHTLSGISIHIEELFAE
jgi:Uma2 family endonuclease